MCRIGRNSPSLDVFIQPVEDLLYSLAHVKKLETQLLASLLYELTHLFAKEFLILLGVPCDS